MPIYKIFRRPEWDAFRAAGETAGAPVDLADGFIHFSTAAQVAETAARHFTTESDLVLVAVGVRPNVELASGAGLAVADGIAVDGHLRSSDPRVFAIGDCANFPLAGRRVRLESVQAAADHARHVARTIAGQEQPPMTRCRGSGPIRGR